MNAPGYIGVNKCSALLVQASALPRPFSHGNATAFRREAIPRRFAFRISNFEFLISNFEFIYALCPPICLFLLMVVAPSSRFIPFKIAFPPNFFRMEIIALCRDFSFTYLCFLFFSSFSRLV